MRDGFRDGRFVMKYPSVIFEGGFKINTGD
jgi:hypothetical protein